MSDQATMGFRFLRRCVVVFHLKPEPSEAEWDAYLSQLGERPDLDKFLVYTLGGAPNGKQRAALNEVCVKREPQIAVLTSSSVVRGVLTALQWMGWSNAKPFAQERIDDALAYLGLSAAEADESRHVLNEMRAEISGTEDRRSKTG